jgi:hypothetical protein
VAKLGDLKDKLARDIDAEDGYYATDITDAVEEAVRHYSKLQFWFSDKEITFPMVVAREYYDATDHADIPKLHKIHDVWHQDASGNRCRLDRVYNSEISSRSSFTNGSPTCFSYVYNKIRIYPPPSTTETLIVEGWVRYGVPETDNDENEWTNEGFDLIYNRARSELEANALKDTEEALKFKAKEQEVLLALQGINDDRQRLGVIEGTVT